MPRGVYERKKGNKPVGPAPDPKTARKRSSAADIATATPGEDQITSHGSSPTTHSPPVLRRQIPAQRTDEDLTPSERHERNKELYPELYEAAEKAIKAKLKTDKNQRLTARAYIRIRRRNRAPVHHDPYETLSEDESDAETSWHRKKMHIQKKRKVHHHVAVASTPAPVPVVQTEVAPALDPVSSPLSSPPASDSNLKPVASGSAPQIAPSVPVRRGMRWTVEERQLIIDIFNEHADEPRFTITEMTRVWVARMGGHRTIEAVNLEYQKYKAYYSKRELPSPEVFGRLKRVPKGVAKKADVEVAEEAEEADLEGAADQVEE
ncbi:uncharacterized protein BDZ99DRAFT_567049 [Mytilinidion resinicola]|uniref:Uncharacterized protein n=1 Tax=Mytilinidion resinicola TaxID=574789 RepID=A0A6A6Z1Y4_9PEZI|nr:uncharacterized protein BDZ99DRAFT_567049 [Mytilinidion resinicola]KAF2815156.1 hypothetical protein BDZ99DRAFT_567049 [Mytilinidion resinicola]